MITKKDIRETLNITEPDLQGVALENRVSEVFSRLNSKDLAEKRKAIKETDRIDSRLCACCEETFHPRVKTICENCLEDMRLDKERGDTE